MWIDWDAKCNIDELVGVTLASVDGLTPGSEVVTFTASDGRKWGMAHSQDCCESVDVNDVCGDVADLTGSPIVMAEVVSNADTPPKEQYDESFTWTFYRVQTERGLVTIRWYGTSNGYYSEDVEFYRIPQDEAL